MQQRPRLGGTGSLQGLDNECGWFVDSTPPAGIGKGSPDLLPAVHQAVGMITVQMDTTEEARLRLRPAAFSVARPINELAADVVAGRMRYSKEER